MKEIRNSINFDEVKLVYVIYCVRGFNKCTLNYCLEWDKWVLKNLPRVTVV